MKLILASLIVLLSGAAFSQECTMQMSSKNIAVHWTAFKTPSKVGVKGSFNELGLHKSEFAAKSLSALLTGVHFAIKTDSVNTKNAPRDAKIAKFFFKKVKEIKGSIVEADQSSLTIEFEMNGVKKEVPMTLELNGEKLIAKGVMDILDFSMGEHLKSLNKACYDLHQGKTWSDVELVLTAHLTKNCK